MVGAVALWLADRLGSRRREIDGLSLPGAVTIGLSQALALLPGISRSGATISAGLALGLTRESAARFSFLLATPITLGAGLYGSRKLLDVSHTGTEWLAIAAGFARRGHLRDAGDRLPAVVAAAPVRHRLQRLSAPLRRAHRRARGGRPLRSNSSARGEAS